MKRFAPILWGMFDFIMELSGYSYLTLEKDNQWAFKYGAMIEFGERDHHTGYDGEIISHKTIEQTIDEPGNEAYHIMLDGRKVGG